MRHGTVLIGGDEVKAQQVANQIALAQAVAEHQLKKIFTFHRNLASARSFTSEGGEGIGTHLPDFAALHVNGAMSTAARDGLMTEFKAARQVRPWRIERALPDGRDRSALAEWTWSPS